MQARIYKMPLVKIPSSDRLAALPEYAFGALDALKQKLVEEGKELIDLSLGSPDRPTDPSVIKALTEGMSKLRNQQYPIFNGSPKFKSAVADWVKGRFGVELDKNLGVLPLLGTKEGIAHLAFAYISEGDVTLVPSPCYPVHVRGTLLAGGQIYHMELNPENNFVCDLESIPEEILNRAKLMILNYPHNPTGATIDKEYFKKAVDLCRKHDIILANDLAYSEIYFEEKPCSIMEIEGAEDVAIEFHTFSKTYNMAGFRLGFAIGHPDIVQTLYKLKTNVDYGVCMGIQDAGIAALALGDDYRKEIRDGYRARRDLVVKELRDMGWSDLQAPGGAMYVWVPIPANFKNCNDYCKELLEQAGIAVVPGNTFGHAGERFFRIALIQNEEVLQKAMDKIRASALTP